MVYAQGTRKGTASYASFRGATATSWGVADTSSSSLLAKSVAPPPRAGSGAFLDAWQRKEPGSRLMVWAVPLLFPGIFVVIPAIAGIVLGWVGYARWRRYTREYNSAVWPKLYEQWQRRWVCTTCGAIWTPEPFYDAD
ncbi:hypothetical protein GCM10022286_00810 [Gryllotalpicola daejeonensis]|uniref:DUF4389 domain-containing protein n=2 Tax=Gryllotalpicola daejeonensis TaxID=993087 RepID=A0ABP7ZCZ6_9MICO